MNGGYSWCCHIEQFSVTLPMVKLEVVTQQIMKRISLILRSARSILQVRWSALLINIHLCVCSRIHTLSARSSHQRAVNHQGDQQDCVRSCLRSVSKIIGYLPPLLPHSFSSRVTAGLFSCAINHCLVARCLSNKVENKKLKLDKNKCVVKLEKWVSISFSFLNFLMFIFYGKY